MHRNTHREDTYIFGVRPCHLQARETSASIHTAPHRHRPTDRHPTASTPPHYLTTTPLICMLMPLRFNIHNLYTVCTTERTYTLKHIAGWQLAAAAAAAALSARCALVPDIKPSYTGHVDSFTSCQPTRSHLHLSLHNFLDTTPLSIFHAAQHQPTPHNTHVTTIPITSHHLRSQRRQRRNINALV